MTPPRDRRAADRRILEVQGDARDAWVLATALADSLRNLSPEDFKAENNRRWGGRVEAAQCLADTIRDRVADVAAALDPVVILRAEPRGPDLRPAA